ncbi:hypothetical protein [Zoogloea sp.]|jgi:hypothetical protein|uniref:hypothetical protein n=1 Tax=Zoogloea sp. TaxID=49181 RepID=UPI0035B06EC3
MLSIIDLRDFIDLDHETVQIVNDSTQLSDAQATELARELLKTEQGVLALHEMFREQIAEASGLGQYRREQALHKAYAYFARKYPMPGVL